MLTIIDPQLLFGIAAIVTSLAALVTSFRTRKGNPRCTGTAGTD